jgi:mannose-6-phosphate isomerase-like protein (cupin superfamily)
MINTLSQLQPRVLPPEAGPTLSFLGVSIAYKVSSADTNGALALLEYLAPPKFAGPPLHWHKRTSETFYVLEGTLTFRQGDEAFKGDPGAMVYIPAGILHTFSNQEDTPTRFLTFVAPGGFEEYFKELAVLAQSEPIWPPQDMSKLLALYEKYDLYFPDR